MGLLVLSDGCTVPAELDVDLGLSTSTGPAGLWDDALWDDGIWGPDIVWEPVGSRVRSVSTDGSFSRGWGVWGAGKITVVFDNTDGALSPDNLDPAAPYVVAGMTTIRAGIPIRARLTYAGVSYDLFFGYITSWGEEWAVHSPRQGDALVTVEGIDAWGRLAKAKGYAVSPSVGTGDTYGQRIDRILKTAGFTGSLDTDVGYVTFQATDLSDDRVTELNDTAEAEGGLIWADPSGTIIARDRYSLVENLRSVEVQAEFGDGNTISPVCWLNEPWVPTDGMSETPWAVASVAPITDDMIINHAIYTRVGGTPQDVNDPNSIALYGDRTDTIDDLMCETDAQVLALATWRVLVGTIPEARVDRLTFYPQCDLTNLLPLLLSLKIGDLVSIKLRPPTNYASHVMLRYCHISGRTIEIQGNAITISFDFESATAYRTYSLSRWDVGLWGIDQTDINGARWFV